MKNKILWTISFVFTLAISHNAWSGSKWLRVSWDKDGSNQATISFTPSGNNNNAYVSYGYSTNQENWLSEPVTFSTSMASISSKHSRINNLPANSPVYFKICDDNGCGERFWFKTAADDNSPFVYVAGGDTRSGWTNRQQGNRLIAKLRPLFIMHGGDFTNSNNQSEWTQWFKDWALTYTNDTINGQSFKRIYPLISTHGNHEDGDILTICKMFGIDPNRNNQCSAKDSYYGTQISPLLRVYTLNSQFMYESSSLQNAQNDWLNTDLINQGANVHWRVAQYHKPMFPHYTGKSDNTKLYNWWAQTFYDQAMNLVVESDTHMTKLTEVLEPMNGGFGGQDEGVNSGTVYVGEGSWGAPARSANDAKSWTIDLASIQQFKVISVTETEMKVRTVQFNNSAQQLSRAEREAKPTALPNAVNWWSANNIGEVLELQQNNSKRTVMSVSNSGDDNNNGDTEITLSASEDIFVSSSNANNNYNNVADQLLSDGSDSAYGVIDTLIKWDMQALPSCAAIETAKIRINVFDPSSGTYAVKKGINSWTEVSATWNSINGIEHQGVQIGSTTPSSEGPRTITLNSQGLELIQSWLTGQNNGVVITSTGTTNGIDFNDKENGNAPKLILSYHEDNCSVTEPIANFESSINNLRVIFSDTSDANGAEINDWLWRFGDSQTSSLQSPTHQYEETGNYNVELVVTNTAGEKSSIIKTITVQNDSNTEILDVKIKRNNDDAEESSSGDMSRSSTDIELVFDSSNQVIGLRYRDVNIPQGATIINAYIQFTVDEIDASSASLTIFGEDKNNAGPFKLSSFNISNRKTTNASVSWLPPAWNEVGASGPNQRTPNLSNIVQEIVNRDGWKAGNKMVFIISGSGKITAESYNGDSDKAARLHIEFKP